MIVHFRLNDLFVNLPLAINENQVIFIYTAPNHKYASIYSCL